MAQRPRLFLDPQSCCLSISFKSRICLKRLEIKKIHKNKKIKLIDFLAFNGFDRKTQSGCRQSNFLNVCVFVLLQIDTLMLFYNF